MIWCRNRVLKSELQIANSAKSGLAHWQATPMQLLKLQICLDLNIVGKIWDDVRTLVNNNNNIVVVVFEYLKEKIIHIVPSINITSSNIYNTANKKWCGYAYACLFCIHVYIYSSMVFACCFAWLKMQVNMMLL